MVQETAGNAIHEMRARLINAECFAEDALTAEFVGRARCEQKYIAAQPSWGERGGPGSNEDDRKRLLKLAVADDPKCQQLHRDYQTAECEVRLIYAEIEAFYISHGYQPPTEGER